jgi:hypothetical protein
VTGKVMHNQLQEHLKKYSILADEQLRFRADSSSGNVIYKLINKSLQALNEDLSCKHIIQ